MSSQPEDFGELLPDDLSELDDVIDNELDAEQFELMVAWHKHNIFNGYPHRDVAHGRRAPV